MASAAGGSEFLDIYAFIRFCFFMLLIFLCGSGKKSLAENERKCALKASPSMALAWMSQITWSFVWKYGIESEVLFCPWGELMWFFCNLLTAALVAVLWVCVLWDWHRVATNLMTCHLLPALSIYCVWAEQGRMKNQDSTSHFSSKQKFSLIKTHEHINKDTCCHGSITNLDQELNN